MIYKLKTSLETQEILAEVNKATNLQNFILVKLAISLSLREGPLKEEDFNTDKNGLEFSRQTIFGDTDLMYKALIINNEGRAVPEEEYFPKLVKAHIDRGAKILLNEKKYSRNLYVGLCKLDENI